LNAMSEALASFLNFFLSSSYISSTARILFIGIDYLTFIFPSSNYYDFIVRSIIMLSQK